MKNTSLPELSVVVLCYKSGEYARTFYSRISKILDDSGIDYELVLVGNYWPNTGDKTPDIVKDICSNDPKSRYVVKIKTDRKEHFMGWDMRAGFKASTGQTIAVIDGDGQMDPIDIPRMYHRLVSDGFDVCKAKRISRGDGIYRKIISYIFNTLMFILFPGIASHDINGKPKIFTRNAYEKMLLQSNDWFIDAEIMIRALQHNMKVCEVETYFYDNPERHSFISFKANVEFIKNMLKWRLKIFSETFKKLFFS